MVIPSRVSAGPDLRQAESCKRYFMRDVCDRGQTMVCRPLAVSNPVSKFPCHYTSPTARSSCR